MNRRQIWIGLIIAGIIVAGVLSFNHYATKDPDAQHSFKIRLSGSSRGRHIGFYTAEEFGYFTDENLSAKVTLSYLESYVPVAVLVADNADEFGIARADEIVSARAKGHKVVALAVVQDRCPFVLYHSKEQQISQAGDLRGKTIGVRHGGSEEILYRALLKRANILPSEVREVPVGRDVAAFFAEEVDVWPGDDWHCLFMPKAADTIRYLSPYNIGIRYYGDVLFTTEAMIRENPILVRKVVKSIIRGWEYALRNPSKVLPHFLNNPDLSLSERQELAQLDHHKFRRIMGGLDGPPHPTPFGAMDAEVWNEMHQVLLDQRIIARPIDVDAVFDASFLPDQQ